MAFLILHSQHNTSMTSYGASLSNTLNTTSQEYIVVFLNGLKEVFVFNESLTLGQHTLIGNFTNLKNIYFKNYFMYLIFFI